MREFTPDEWTKIRAEMKASPAKYGLPARVAGSAVVGCFNIRKLGKIRAAGGDSGRDEDTMKFLRDTCKRYDLLAVQEVMEDMTAIRRLKEMMGVKYGLVVSGTTGTFPGRSGNTERMAFIYNTDIVERAELVTDISFDRTEVLERLFQSRKKINTALAKYAEKLEAGKDPKIRMPEFLAFIRTPFAAEFKIGGYEFLAINAHLFFGNYAEDRRLEAKALAEWVIEKVRATETLNAVLLGDLNLDYNKPANDLQRIVKVAKELRAGNEKRVRIAFPFLFPHPKPPKLLPPGEKAFRTNVLLTETYDQIGIFSQDERLGDRLESNLTGHANVDAWGRAKKGPDYGVFNFTELFSKALTGKTYHKLVQDDEAEAERLIAKFEDSVSDHLPLWLRVPLP